MVQISRRSALSGVGTLAGLTALAGCVDDGSDRSTDADETDADTDDPPAAVSDVTVHQVGRALSGPAWRRDERPGFCTLIEARDDAAWLLRDADAETTAFVDETDFDAAVLLYVESVGPNTCYGRVAVEDVSIAEDRLTATATAVETGEEGAICGQAITYVGAFCRVTVAPAPSTTRVTITDGFDTTATLTEADGVRDPAALEGVVEPSGDPPAVPKALTCPDDAFERAGGGYEPPVNWGAGGGVTTDAGLALRVRRPDGSGEGPTDDDGRADTAMRFERGETVRVQLTNVSARPIGVGNRHKYAFEVQTADGWVDVRGDDDGVFEYTDELVRLPPGAGFEWSIELTESGVVADHPQSSARVCPSLQPGRYRFVFWGANDLAVAFDYLG
jgi:hypothetical protein